MKRNRAVTYAEFVNYAGFDAFKIACQEAGRLTATNLKLSGFNELTWTRGESAYVMETPQKGKFVATVEEGLGTKSIPADKTAEQVAEAIAHQQLAAEMKNLTGRSFFDLVSQCNVGAIINDLITSGAAPVAFMLHLAVGNTKWFENAQRTEDVIKGTRIGCDNAGCSWGGGETPVLVDMVVPGTALLSGSATGYISSKKRLINPANIRAGDAIILFESSGPGANGYSMLRNTVAPRLKDGYLTMVTEDGRSFGEAILAPTIIYARLIQALLNAGVHIHYAINITGHGWRKLMRANQPFAYVINRLPRRQPLFDFVQEHNPISIKEMYGTFNMGAGFAIYVPRREVELVSRVTSTLRRFNKFPFVCVCAGEIEESREKRVVIVPANIEFGPADLAIR